MKDTSNGCVLPPPSHWIFSSLGSRSNSFPKLAKPAPTYLWLSFPTLSLREGVEGGVSRIKLVTRLPRGERPPCWREARGKVSLDVLRNKLLFSSVMAPILAYWDIRGVSWFKAWFLYLVPLGFSKPVDRFHVSILCEPQVQTFEVFAFILGGIWEPFIKLIICLCVLFNSSLSRFAFYLTTLRQSLRMSDMKLVTVRI